MKSERIVPHKSVSLFVKDIFVFSNDDKNIFTSLPFFADGYHGLIFQQTDNGLTIRPHNKVVSMPEIFLHGQTLRPTELRVFGAYLIIVFQFYPFVLKTLFNVAPQSINDDCCSLDDSSGIKIHELTQQILSCPTENEKIELLSNLLLLYFEQKRQHLDFKIRQAVQCIINTKGQQNIRSIADQLNVNIRTFERRFLNETGLSPKQFSKIIQFNNSLEQLTVKDFTTLTDIVYENGFADQSHFTRVFKAFTGKTPGVFSR